MPLPPFGWTAHAEQTDVYALEERIWQMRTELVTGCKVYTVLLKAPDAETVAQLEAIAEHFFKCKKPNCPIGKNLRIDLLCPGGKYDPAATLFLTSAIDQSGRAIYETQQLTTSPKDAEKMHHGTVAMVIGSITPWKLGIESECV